MILRVAVDAPVRRLFDYREADDGPTPTAGARVWAPFGRRRVIGIVVERTGRSEIPANKLRAASAPLEADPAIDPELLQLLRWAAEYYRHPIGEVITGALPSLLRQGASLRDVQICWRASPNADTDAGAALPKRAARMRTLYEQIRARGRLSTSEANEAVDGAAAVLRALAQRGLIESFEYSAPHLERSGRLQPGPPLNEAQRAAVERIASDLERFASHLLQGVTGSGKTEVYLQLIERVLARGRQALVLVPEIALTPQLLARFTARFDAPIVAMHSALTEHERLEAWRQARDGAARIVIGTRSAVFTALAAPGLIVVDEEHDASFKQQDGFRYSARDLAIVRAQRLNIPIVLGSATPSLETLERAQRQPQWLSRLPLRAGGAQPPRMTLIDLRSNAQTQGLSTPALMAIERHLQANGQVIVFLNRRGYAPVLFCPACGWAAHCLRCDAHFTVHARSSRLLCHHCGAEAPIPSTCASCGAPAKPVGQGTERIEELLTAQFPQATLARIDRDAIRRKGELDALLERVRSHQVQILVGTQMLTKGHDFPNVTLVVVLNADHGLFSTDFRASERLAQTIVQVAGRAGRADRPGEVLIQTEYPDHPLLQSLLSGGYEAFAHDALTERADSGWPPYARIALLRAEGAALSEPMRFLQAARDAASGPAARDVRRLGPAPAPMVRRAGRHRAQLLLHAPNHTALQNFLSGWLREIESLPAARRVRWSLDIDPVELF